MSITSDEWAAKDNSASLVSVTAHFLDENMRPRFVVLAAEPIDGPKTADKISSLIANALSEFELNGKVHLMLRDAASTMRKAATLLGVDSFDCLAHKIQLAIKSG